MVVQTVKKTEEITVKQSLVLVRNMFRAAFCSVAFIRGFFDSSNFEESKVAGAKYRKLVDNGTDPQIKRYIDWLELGVHDALKKKYLDTVLLEVYSNGGGEQSSKILECYSFRVRYSARGAEFRLAAGEDTSDPADSKESITQNLRQVIRSLIDITHQLPPLPNGRRISMRLLYTPNTPEEYEPPMFRAAKDDEKYWFPDKPRRVSISTLSTPHHSIRVHCIRSMTEVVNEEAMDACDEEDVEIPKGSEMEDVSDDDFEMDDKQEKHALPGGRSNAKKNATALQRSKAGGGQKKAAKPRPQKKGTAKTKNANATLKPKSPINKVTKKAQSVKVIDSNDDSSSDAFDSDSDWAPSTKARTKKASPVKARGRKPATQVNRASATKRVAGKKAVSEHQTAAGATQSMWTFAAGSDAKKSVAEKQIV